jgi:hypothetical protein
VSTEGSTQDSKRVVNQFWDALAARDWEGM